MSRSAWEWPNILTAAIAVTLGAFFVGSLLGANLSHGYIIPGQTVLFLLCGLVTAIFWIMAWRAYRKARSPAAPLAPDNQEGVWPPPPVLRPQSQEEQNDRDT